MERLDALSVREGSNGKSYFTKIGAAFPNKDGKGYTVLLDAVPAANEGQVKIMLREPLPKDGEGNGGPQRRNNAHDDDGLDDQVPFVTCDPSLEFRVR